MGIKDLLTSTTSNQIKEAPRFPEGNYRVIISSYVLGTNKNSGAQGVAFGIKPVACIEAEQTDNPDLAEEMTNKLNAYGDWTSKEFIFTYQDKQTKETHLRSFCDVNFLLFDENDEIHKAASFFYVNNDGEESGFAHDVLGLSFLDWESEHGQPANVGDIIEACVNKEFYLMFSYVPDQNDPKRTYLEISNATSL